MKTIVLLCYNSQSIGIKVIVDALRKELGKDYFIRVARNISDLEVDDIVLPFGPKETFEVLRRGYYVPISIMIDYHTLSLRNRSVFLLKKGYFTSKSLWHSLASLVYYYFVEIYIYNRCHNFMLVSQKDIDLLTERFPDNNYYCVPNGVAIPNNYVKKRTNKILTLGILSGWTPGTFIEAKWFVDHYWPKLVKKYGTIELKLCGRFADESMIRYFNDQPNVTFIGEVDDLSVFFDQIDIYVATKPIGCGILNKVLDAMAYKTLVIGIKQSFTGFSYMKDSYIVCDTIEDYINVIDSYVSNYTVFDEVLNNAYANILKYNDWKNNYHIFVRKLIDDGVLD